MERDKFWDGRAVVGESNLDPALYHDASAEFLPLSHRSMASAMPQGTWGATGTIVRRSTEEGAPIGHNPNGVATRVNVDPDTPGQGFVFDPSSLIKEQVNAAAQQANVRQASTIEDRRYRASNVLRAFAVQAQPDPVPQRSPYQNREAPVNMPGVYVVPRASEGGGQELMQVLPVPTSGEIRSVMTATPASFMKRGQDQPQMVAPPSGYQQLAAQHPNYRQPAMADAYASAMPAGMSQHPLMTPNVHPQSAGPQPIGPGMPLGMPQQAQSPQASLFQRRSAQSDSDTQYKAHNANGQPQIGPPTIRVTFEVHGTPFQQESYFHAVVCEGANLVLIFDQRAVGFPRVFPQDTEADVAVAIEGREAIFICKVTGQRFQYDSRDFCILLIKETFPITP